MAETVQIIVDETQEVVNIIVTDTAGPTTIGDTLPIEDTRSVVKNADDNSKTVRIDASAVSPNTTRTIIMPDSDVDLSESGSGSTLPVDDNTSIVRNVVDNTKQVRINAQNVAPNTIRQIIVPDSDVNLADLGDTLPISDDTPVVKSSFDDTRQVRISATNVSPGTTRIITMPDADVDLGSLGDTLPVDDTTPIVQDPVDNTKQVRIDAGAVSANTTRTITMPDADVDLGSLGDTLPVDDTTPIVQDPVDNTKQVRIDAGAVSANTTRTITMPDADVDLGNLGNRLPVDDTTPLVQDPVDTTKQVRIDAGAVSANTTRTIIMPDTDVDLGSLIDTLPVDDTTPIVQDPVDNTKQVRIDAGALSADTTRSITMPDFDVNLGLVNTALQPGANISELNNDSGFVTSAEVPTNTSQLNNDSGFITAAEVPATQDVFTPITEGGNSGHGTVFRAANPDNYADIGQDAVDLTFSNSPSTTRGITGDRSVGIGVDLTETGIDNIFTGRNSTLQGNANSVQARDSDVNGSSNLVLGDNVSIAGDFNAAITSERTLQGNQMTALGTQAFPGATRGIAIGNQSKTFSFGETNINGLFSTDYTPSSTTGIVGTDRLLNVAKGDFLNRADAFTILKNNKTGIGFSNFETTTEEATLQVNGLAHSNASISQIDAGSSGVLTSKQWTQAEIAKIFDSDSGTSGIPVRGRSGGVYSVGSQSWNWRRVGGLTFISLRFNQINGTAPTGTLNVAIGDAGFPSSLNSDDFYFNVVITGLTNIQFSQIQGQIDDSGNVIRFLIQESGGPDGSNFTTVESANFSNGLLAISGMYIAAGF